jgi:SAM-dependent methyltransferase
VNGPDPFWQERYRQQASWTADLRRYAFTQTGLPKDACLLEIGCGPGALLEGLRSDGYSRLTGLDIDWLSLQNIPHEYEPLCADGLTLPFSSASFDACLCHFLLLWVKEPLQALREMRRVASPGGWLLALAEPDYGARLDEPAELKPLGELQTHALARQGADPCVGARLNELFHELGLTRIESGVIEKGSQAIPAQKERDLEWAVLARDLGDTLSPAELERWRTLDEKAWAVGSRRLYVPVHYAFGQIPPEY